MNWDDLNKYRMTPDQSSWGTTNSEKYGLFFVPSIIQPASTMKVMVAPMDSEWQHVSVSLERRCPNWPEMCQVKDLVWGEDVIVIQFHPKKSEYVNMHPYCLHLWRRPSQDIELPPSILV